MRQKNSLPVSLFIVGVLGIALAYSAFGQDWKELKSDHFIVRFTSDERFAKDVLDKAEMYYRRIATDLGYPRYSEFWTWDNRVKISIYPTHAAFLKAVKQPEWSHGMADYSTKEIISYTWGEGFLESLLPHEMAHLIFRDFIGFKGEVPLWLDEGVAQWSEDTRRSESKKMIKQLYENDMLLTLDDMMKIDLRSVKGRDRVYIRKTLTRKGETASLILGAENLVSTYYLQSASLVGFLINSYGSNSFAGFCRELRDGKTLEEALAAAYPTHIKSLKDLELRWRDSIERS